MTALRAAPYAFGVRAATWTTLALTTLLVGCGRLETSPATIDEPQFADAFAASLCGAFSPCCAKFGEAPTDDCEARQRDAIRAELDRALEVGAKYDPVAAARCVADLAVMLATCPTTKTYASLESCAEVFTAKPTSAGAPCSSAWECADDGAREGFCATTYEVDGAVTGRCEQTTILRAGERCVTDAGEIGGTCKRPLLCAYNGSGTCQPYARLGEPCLTGPNWGDTCEPGATCDRRASKRCVAAKKVGEPCEQLEECEELRCGNGRCVPPLTPIRGICSESNPP